MYTKKIFYPLFVILMILGFQSCSKDEVCSQVGATPEKSEVDSLRSYLDAQNIEYVEDSRGFFYTIEQQSSGVNKPTICADILITFQGNIIPSESQFASASDAVYDLSTRKNTVSSNVMLPIGTRYAIPLMTKGSKYTFYFPPTLGYGLSGTNTVPSNSMISMTIKLVSFN